MPSSKYTNNQKIQYITLHILSWTTTQRHHQVIPRLALIRLIYFIQNLLTFHFMIHHINLAPPPPKTIGIVRHGGPLKNISPESTRDIFIFIRTLCIHTRSQYPPTKPHNPMLRNVLIRNVKGSPSKTLVQGECI